MALHPGRQNHLTKQALAIAILAIERQEEGPMRPDSDLDDMRAWFAEACDAEEQARYMRLARRTLGIAE